MLGTFNSYVSCFLLKKSCLALISHDHSTHLTTLWCRISHFHNVDLLQLAMQNYEFKQSIFKSELKELMRSDLLILEFFW